MSNSSARENTKQAFIAYLVKPNLSLRLQLNMGESNLRNEADLGFQGVFRILRGRQLKIQKEELASTDRSPIRSLALYKFSKDMFVLLAKVEQKASLRAWKDLENPALKRFPEQLFSQLKGRVEFIKTPAPIIFVVDHSTGSHFQPAVWFTNEYASGQLATRLVLTDAVERLLMLKISNLSVGNYNLSKLNRILHATTQWHAAWRSSGRNVPKLVESYVKSYSKNVDFNQYKDLVGLSINREQRRIAWASGSAVAFGNLAASTIPQDGIKWVPWAAFLLIFITMYLLKPFTRL